MFFYTMARACIVANLGASLQLGCAAEKEKMSAVQIV
jgi:hypothetical protein